MKPRIIMHMISSIDGRIVTMHWPKEIDITGPYELVHRQLAGDAWLVGPTTMAEYSQGEPVPVTTTETFPRKTWKAPEAEKGPYAIALDRKGRLHLNTGNVNEDVLIAVLTTRVSDEHLAELRRDGISYIFAGDTDIDLSLALETLALEFGIEQLLLEGGGGINGAFLDAVLIDEISLLVLPIADGACGVPSLFDRTECTAARLKLKSITRMDNDVLHLRYLTV